MVKHPRGLFIKLQLQSQRNKVRIKVQKRPIPQCILEGLTIVLHSSCHGCYHHLIWVCYWSIHLEGLQMSSEFNFLYKLINEKSSHYNEYNKSHPSSTGAVTVQWKINSDFLSAISQQSHFNRFPSIFLLLMVNKNTEQSTATQQNVNLSTHWQNRMIQMSPPDVKEQQMNLWCRPTRFFSGRVTMSTAGLQAANKQNAKELDNMKESISDIINQLQDIDPTRLSFSPFLDLDTQISLAPVSDSPESSVEELHSSSHSFSGSQHSLEEPPATSRTRGE